MPATMNAITTDGPARSAIAAAVRTKRPAPMIAPMPRAISAPGPRVRFSVPSPVAAASASSLSTDFVRNKAFDTKTSQGYQPSRLYAEPLDVGARASFRVGGRQQVADHGDR